MAAKLKAEHKKTITEDFSFAAKMMKESPTVDAKLFYFSSTFGTLSRIINTNFDLQLVLMHTVLTAVHSTILTRLAAMKGGEQSISLKEELFDKLATQTDELAARIKNDTDAYDILEKINLLGFAATGNGYYLLQKGAFSI
jgi:hypothetical protein